jgi:hypothetical protein
MKLALRERSATERLDVCSQRQRRSPPKPTRQICRYVDAFIVAPKQN